uniref:SHSP domain-containing protein n=1 Tax=Ananas comosus var. bracteatus TaxID=296719 RepID=A0A6V7QWZ8_ANACO
MALIPAATSSTPSPSTSSTPSRASSPSAAAAAPSPSEAGVAVVVGGVVSEGDGGVRGRPHRLEGDPEAHVFQADLPGLKKEEVKVEVEEGNVLRISGERTREQEEKTDTWHRVERSSGKFLRSFRLPDNAKTDEVKATMENGVLTVTVPRRSRQEARGQARPDRRRLKKNI